MSIRYLRDCRFSAISLVCWVFLSCFPGYTLSAAVTLSSIELYRTHEWLPSKPTVYFKCKEENKKTLPDVKKENVLYSFKDEESWQPLTEFSSKKCKRCGFYEEDSIKSDDVFDEWELCPSDFTDPSGIYTRFKEKEFSATFTCPQCKALSPGSNSTSDSHGGRKRVHLAVIIIVSALVSTIFVLGILGAYKYWQKKKREQDQARFLKLFEDGDDIEDEFGLAM